MAQAKNYGGDEIQGCFAFAPQFPDRGLLGMPCNCTQGVNNSGGQARSMHAAGGVNVAMADGSLRFIKNSIARMTWWGLGTKANSEIIGSDSY